MDVRLDSIRRYFASLSWYAGGNLSTDAERILNFLESQSADSRFFVAESKRSVGLLRFWRSQLSADLKRFRTEFSQAKLRADPGVRQSLRDSRVHTRQGYVDAEILAVPECARCFDNVTQHEMIADVVDGLLAALSDSLLVQESVSTRRLEEADSNN